MKKLWKNNKITILFITVIIVMISVLAALVFPLYSSRGGSVYGKRLDGIKDVKIENSLSNNIKDAYKNTEKVKKVTTDLKGKIYNILVYVNDGVDLNEFVDFSNGILSNFEEEQLKFYDIQFFLISDSDENKKTIIGYKNKDSESISWTNNR
ncbi:MAG: hypothetical protein E7166_02070 [Firmicutes bacterium]|nr:hypothetical protein [Bacillota bacterium]